MMLKQYALQLPDNILYEVILFELVTEQKRKKHKNTQKKPHSQTIQKNKTITSTWRLYFKNCFLS